MTDYTILIHGTGKTKHSNIEIPYLTADQLLEEFIKQLKENGHVVEVATITHGGRESVIAE